MPTVHRCQCRSDGCRAQYKGRHRFGFISSHGADGIRVPMACLVITPVPTGKCLCDPEGGTCKSAASFYENHSDGGHPGICMHSVKPT